MILSATLCLRLNDSLGQLEDDGPFSMTMVFFRPPTRTVISSTSAGLVALVFIFILKAWDYGIPSLALTEGTRPSPSSRLFGWKGRTLNRMSVAMQEKRNEVRREFPHLTLQLCVLYDSPPHTGSSAVAGALEKCMRQVGFAVVHYSRRLNTTQRSRMQFTSRKAIARSQVATFAESLYEEPQSVFFLLGSVRHAREIVFGAEKKCEHLLHVSSTRTMRGRLLAARNHFDKDRPRKQKEFIDREFEFEGRSDDETPGYVIRYRRFGRDLSALLRALGCDDVAEAGEQALWDGSQWLGSASRSAQKINGGDWFVREWWSERVKRERVEESVRLRGRDERHVRLSTVAMMFNDHGLRKAVSFRKLMQASNVTE